MNVTLQVQMFAHPTGKRDQIVGEDRERRKLDPKNKRGELPNQSDIRWGPCSPYRVQFQAVCGLGRTGAGADAGGWAPRREHGIGRI
jgi:hypothetical protein